jgi:DNA modification methylase
MNYHSGLPDGSALVWIKKNDACFGTFLSDAELAWMKGGCGVYCFRDLSMNAIARSRVHPNQKPVSLLQWCIEKMKSPGQILDPYAGSGTVSVACERMNIKWIAVEIDEKYCEIAAKRIENEAKQMKLFG